MHLLFISLFLCIEIISKHQYVHSSYLSHIVRKKTLIELPVDVEQKYHVASTARGGIRQISSYSSNRVADRTSEEPLNKEQKLTNVSATRDVSKNKTVDGQSDEPEECAEDDTSADGKEDEFVSGVQAINSLTKDEKLLYKKDNKKKSEKKKKKKNEFSTDIDLKDIQNLFKGKDIEKFQENFTAKMKKKAFEELKKKLYNKGSKLKILDSFDSVDNNTDIKLHEMLEKTLKKEENSIKYKINFPMFYHAVGTITLPFDDLVEPFETWYAGELNMSRIDYYYGMDKSYQRGDIGKHGVVVKITPAHWSKKADLDENTISCWYKEESKWSNRRGQTVIPMNVKKFKYAGPHRFNGVPAYKFVYQKRFVDKNNTYTFHVSQSKPYKPLRYEMIGYDHLLRSHYDHYIIDYFSFEPWKFDYKVLQIPKEFKCYKKLKKMKSHFEANPMWDFLHSEEPGHREDELSETYTTYKHKHDKQYDDLENQKRKDIFRHNARFVHSHNRAKLNYSLELNHFSDLSDEEFEMMKGQPNVDTPDMQKELNDIPQLRLEIPTTPLLTNLDWRDYGVVSAVHSQSFCASCWAFSAVGAIEAAFAIQNGSLEELSVQELIDCSWGYDNNGCRGGWSWRALKFVGEHGLATRKSYGKYLGQESYCHCGKKDNCEIVKKISYRTIEKHDAEKLKVALSMFGPGSISVQCARKTFKFYSSGIYDDPKCGNKTDHAVVIVGYGEENQIPYWLIKNSWGKLWGNKGYIKIAMKKDLCGVLQNGALMVSMGTWKKDGFPFQKMKKIKKQNTENFSKLQNEESILDLFSPSDHVTRYIENNKY